MSNTVLKASSEEESMLSTWAAFVYVLIAGGFRYMNFNEININEFSTFHNPMCYWMYYSGDEIMYLVTT